jgi:hypothetical protein
MQEISATAFPKNMTSAEIKQAIFDELNEREINSWHGITKYNIDQLLVEPTTIELVDVLGQRNMYWLVLDEQPGDLKDGYRVVYDEREDEFGLATKTATQSKEVGLLVGLYGSFVDALDNM